MLESSAVTHSEQHQWWQPRTSDEPLKVPPKTKDTIYRDGYMRDGPMSAKGFTRHEANPNKDAAYGVVPVNFLSSKDGQNRIFHEKKSDEHQYDSRKDLIYSIRNKSHGIFVWDQASYDKAENWIQKQKGLAGIEKSLTEVDGANIVSPYLSPIQPLPKEDSPAKSQPATTTQSRQTLTTKAAGDDTVSKNEASPCTLNGEQTVNATNSGEK